MEYREIGKTGIRASVIGLGSEGLARIGASETVQVFDCAMDKGVNIMDCCLPGEELQANIRRALRSRRKDMLIQGHIGSTATDGQYDVSRDIKVCKENFEALLSGLETDYIDFGMFFFVDTNGDFLKIFEGELLGYAQNLKKRGIIRAVGASCHNSEVACRIVETGIVDLIMFSVNPVFDMTPADSDIYALLDDTRIKERFTLKIEPGRAKFYQLCEQREVSITVMKTLCAGKLLSADLSPFGTAMTAGQRIHYALTRPAVASVLLGCKSEGEVLEAVSYLEQSEEERDYSRIISGGIAPDTREAPLCLYCNHCLPVLQGLI
jgi:predicted aldo/keto reductase-like oxidoreductase